MAKIDRIVNVQISLNTTAIKQQTFSDMLILGPHILSPQRSLVITEADQLLDLGMSTTDPIYRAALAVFSQIPSITRVFIGRQQVGSVPFTVTSAAAAPNTVRIGWLDAQGQVQNATVSVTPQGGDTVTDVAADIVAAINASPAGAAVTASNAAGVVTVVTDTAGAPFSLDLTGNLQMGAIASTESPADALPAIAAETDDWYGVVMTSREDADILAAAEWVEANEKLLGVSTDDVNAKNPGNTTDIGSQLQQRQFFRTHVWYHQAAMLEWLEAAISSNRFTYYPGGETWANARLAGISYDNLMEGEATALHNKNINTFEPFRNFAITQNGKVAAGEWIDVIRFRDWLAEQVKINVVSALINAGGKIPYTDPGITVIVAALRKALDMGVARGGIAPPEMDTTDPEAGRMVPSYVINAPRSMDVAFNDKANRILRDVNFTARLAGAIHAVEIKGALSYAL